jgi:protein-tyrosine phosphatase
MFRNILIVCHANVCRSPAAEMLFVACRVARRPAPDVPFRGRACERRRRHRSGDAAPARRARRRCHDASFARLSRRIVRDADLILVSERGQIAAVEAVDPFARGKVHLLGKWRTPRSPIRMAAPRPTIARATH